MFKETLPVVWSNPEEAASTKTIAHMSQIIASEEFRYFDYGAKENLKRYKSEEPPPYNLTNLRVPMYIIRSNNDRISPKKVKKDGSSIY